MTDSDEQTGQGTPMPGWIDPLPWLSGKLIACVDLHISYLSLLSASDLREFFLPFHTVS